MWNQLVLSPDLSAEPAQYVKEQLTILRNDLKSEQFNKSKRCVRNLIDTDEGFLIWNSRKQCISHVQIKNHNQVTAFQNLQLSHPPMFEVFGMKLNEDHKYIMLSGRRSLNVVEMPSKWATRLYDNGKRDIMTKSWSLVERYFVCSEKVTLLDAHWHPGSSQHNHVAILTNDNHIRIIDIHDPDVCVQEINLDKSDEGLLNFTVSVYALELGEGAVSFDFGSPILRNAEQSKSAEIAREELIDKKFTYWPIYVLKGNGDLLLVYNSLHNIYISKQILGPLKMYPSAEDNYGVDVCSLIVIKTNPCLIVIGTSTGMIHHCIALPVDDNHAMSNHLPTVNIYVYESIELTLTLTSSVDIDNPLKLIKIEHNHESYFCLHYSGVHLVKIPFLKQMQENGFIESEPEDTIVEHLICTQPIVESSEEQNTCFPVGVALAVRSTFLLFIALSNGKMFTQRLAPINYELHKYMVGGPSKEDAHGESKATNLKIVEFNECIKKLLQRKQNAPLVSTQTSDKQANNKECFQFLINLTQIFRSDYVSKLESVHESIGHRSQALIKAKQLQQQNVNELQGKVTQFVNDSVRISNKYHEALNRQRLMSQRVHKLTEKALHNYKQPSKAEMEQNKKVEQINKELDAFREKLNEMERKYNYYDKIYKNKCKQKGADRQANSLASPDWKNVEKVLHQQMEQIKQLVQRMQSLKQQSAH